VIGFITCVTPFLLHEAYYRYLNKNKNAGRIGYEPNPTQRSLYEILELKLETSGKLRFQAKPSISEDVKRARNFSAKFKEMRWFEPEEIRNQFRIDVNEKQIKL